MDEPRPILYGVSDYAEIRKANAWFVDRTAKLRDLERVRYAVFLRPRRFGKSLLLSILEAYYDIRYAAGGDLTGTGDSGAVSLHRLVLVFRGGDCILREEV